MAEGTDKKLKLRVLAFCGGMAADFSLGHV